MFSFTVLEGKKIAVWLHDGNVLYLQGKHVALFLAALLLLLTVSLPCTTLLLFSSPAAKIKTSGTILEGKVQTSVWYIYGALQR